MRSPFRAFRLPPALWLPLLLVILLSPLSATPSARRFTPTISADIWPEPNANNWNNASVVVRFTCTDAPVSCSSPVPVTTETTNFEVEGTADDGVTEVDTSAFVNIDVTAPSVTITSPSSGSTTATSVNVVATVSDARSGVGAAYCNGEPATIDAGEVECSVPLEKGRNAIIVSAVDLAGNSRSHSIRVTRTGTPTALRAAPTSRMLVVAQTQELSVVDDFGQVVSGVTWTTDDDGVADISVSGGVSTLEAVGSGSATLTATSGALSTTVDVTVVAALAAGNVAWRSAPEFEEIGSQIHLRQVSDEVPAMLVTEHHDGGLVMKALQRNGSEAWRQRVVGATR